MSQSKIEWTTFTWNPVVGCSILSPGCTHCYAMPMAARIEAMNAVAAEKKNASAPQYDGTTKIVNGKPVWTGKLALAPESTLLAPLRRKKPTTYFVNSMGDLFHKDVRNAWRDPVFAVMAITPQHTYQILTKRADVMRDYMNTARLQDDIAKDAARIAPQAKFPEEWPLPNVWLGISAERQQEADERIPHLLATPAAIRFISAESLLGQLNLTRMKLGGGWYDVLAGWREVKEQFPGFENTLDWVICGGESGPDARPMHPMWARGLRQQCTHANVPFFFKQWGAWSPAPESASEIQEDEELRNVGMMFDGQYMRRCSKKAAGRLLDGREHNDMPEVRR